MLDGFDETSNKSAVLKFIREESFNISLRMTILVTSRPQATEDIREDMMSRFSVEGFSEQQQQKYIELMFKDYEDKGKELSEMLKVEESFSGRKKLSAVPKVKESFSERKKLSAIPKVKESFSERKKLSAVPKVKESFSERKKLSAVSKVKESFSERKKLSAIPKVKESFSQIKILSSILKAPKSFSEIKKCPLMLHMICCLYLHDSHCLNGGITDLYIRMISLLIKRYISKSGSNYKFNEGKYFLGEDLLIRLGEARGVTFRDLKEVFPIEEEYNFIVGIGILEFVCFSDYEETAYYQFVHFSFSEFIDALTGFFSDIFINDNVLLFMMGLSGKEPFPQIVQDFFKKQYREHSYTFLNRPDYMLRVYREIKFETNWELFCSLTHLVFWYSELDDVNALLYKYKFTRMHFIFPENNRTYEMFRKKMIDFFINFRNLNFCRDLDSFYNLRETFGKEFRKILRIGKEKSLAELSTVIIFLFTFIDLDDSSIINHNFQRPTKLKKIDCNISDHQEVMSCILDFFNSIGKIGDIICFSGLFPFKQFLCYFRNVEYPIQISEEQKENLNAEENEKFAALHTGDEKEDYFVDYVISAKQYECLRDLIEIFPFRREAAS